MIKNEDAKPGSVTKGKQRKKSWHEQPETILGSPTYECILPFGWYILEINRTAGGLFGYSSVNSSTSLNVPEANSRQMKTPTFDLILYYWTDVPDSLFSSHRQSSNHRDNVANVENKTQSSSHKPSSNGVSGGLDKNQKNKETTTTPSSNMRLLSIPTTDTSKRASDPTTITVYIQTSKISNPKMIAFHFKILSSNGAALMPSGGSVCRLSRFPKTDSHNNNNTP